MSEELKPFVSAQTKMRELTLVPLLSGVFLGILFGASSLYLALKVGMTVSASIPIAVLSITLFKGLSKVFGLRKATILENNIVQTTGSAGESIAFGVAVTMPALLILGFDMDAGRIMTVAVLGGLLGILMMIPLRYSLMVKGHKALPFPEGTACAEVLIVGEKGGTSAKTVFTGFFVGLIYKVLNVGSKLWIDVPERAIGFFKGAQVSAEVSPELLGVGYIIGPRIASIMVAGGILSSFVLIPMIFLFGDYVSTPIFPATKPISQMGVHEIWKNYILYIGAGAVAAGGIISMFQAMPTIYRSAVAGLGGIKRKASQLNQLRTERDIPMSYILFGMIALMGAIWMTPSLHMNWVGALLIIAAGFLFVTVSSRLTGEIGSSSNPISGMTVATLLITSLVFLMLGWTTPMDRVTALSIAAIVCVAASNGGTTAQDLKTGHLVGATPWMQQVAILVGALTSALVIGFTLNVLNDASTIYSKTAVPQNVVVPNVAELTEKAKVGGVYGETDTKDYHVLRVREFQSTGPLAKLQPGKYLADDAGKVTYLVDPGINGVLEKTDDGHEVPKYEAPKARLMSLIIDGILSQKLPWGLVLLGVFISIVLELCGIGSLAFAVGVYLPLSASAPIFIGGMVRWLVGKLSKKKEADSDSSPGVLYSSGLIAGGAIAGIVIAILSLRSGFSEALDLSQWAPGFSSSSLTAILIFGALALSLFRVARKA